jgi:hypothetical protein
MGQQLYTISQAVSEVVSDEITDGIERARQIDKNTNASVDLQTEEDNLRNTKNWQLPYKNINPQLLGHLYNLALEVKPERLNLYGNDLRNSERIILKFVKNIDSITQLEIGLTNMHVSDLRILLTHIADHNTTLEELDICGMVNDMKAVCRVVEKHPRLRRFDISLGSQLIHARSADDFHLLFDAISNNSRITDLGDLMGDCTNGFREHVMLKLCGPIMRKLRDNAAVDGFFRYWKCIRKVLEREKGCDLWFTFD